MTVQRVEELTARLETALEEGADAREVAALSMYLATEAATTLGECRLDPTEYRPLYPVLDADGLRWQCTHHPPHRTEVVVPLAP